MKTKLSITLFFSLFFCVFINSVFGQFSGGNGTENNPYIITTAAELAQLATYVNDGNEAFNSCHYKLGNDIDLSDYQGGEGWTPIGKYADPDYTFFIGVFDGNNKVITGLKINSTNYYNNLEGLFGYVYGGTIKNLGIEDANVVRNLTTNMAYAGILAACIYNSTVSNCYTTGTVSASASSVVRTSDAGGIVGRMSNSTISNCFSLATVSSICSYYAYAGGIVGEIDLNSFSNILNCYSTGAISVGAINANGNSIANVGGVAGYISATELSNCAALNSVINCNSLASNNRSFGRVVGEISGGALASNIAFANMINPDGNTTWNNQGASNRDGLSFTKEQIHADGTLGGRFTSEGGWTTQNGKLPGLFGNVVNMPVHLRIEGLPYINTTIIPDGEVGVTYNQTLAATGNPPMTWSIENGNLPDGLELSEDGIISGIPTMNGFFSFMVKTINEIEYDTKRLFITIENPVPITITTEILLDGEVGISYYKIITATGTKPITWSLESGNLPYGLVLSEDGIISGTPTADGVFEFTVKASNVVGVGAKSFSIALTRFFDSGIGDANDPYIIFTPEDLAQLATLVNEGYSDYDKKHYKLGNDIDLSDYGENFNDGAGWIPIEKSFKGVFDGDNKKITGLYINNTTLRYLGLFCFVDHGTVKNLGVIEVNINSETSSSNFTGGIVGYNSAGNVLNCYATGSVKSYSSDVISFAGGVVGSNTAGSIFNCCFTGSVNSHSSNSSSYSGGITGDNSWGTVSNCYSAGSLNSSASDFTNVSSYSGGVTGYNAGSLLNCYSTCSVNASGFDSYAGGIAGYSGDASNANLSNCAALNQKITCTGNNIKFGRVVGHHNYGSITNNIAFSDMLNPDGGTTWNNIGASNKDGESIPCEDIHADGTLGGRFTNEEGWTTQNGKLPGLFGNVVNLPQYLWCGYPIILSTVLPDGTVNVAYSATLEAAGDEPITWSIEAGSLPTGLTLNENTGEISGIPTAEGTFNFTVKTTNSVGSDTKTLNIFINGVGVVETHNCASLQVHPNPTTGQLTINNEQLTITNVEIYDIYGKKLSSHHLIASSSNHLINISHLPTGVYFLKAGNETVKVVKL